MKVVKAGGSSQDAKKAANEALREVAYLKDLKHPNIVSFKEAFEVGRELCIVMAYCESGDLSGRIKYALRRKRYIEEEQVLGWFVQMMMATEYLHRKHILHRDIKPQNVFLSNSNKVVKLGDFGITKTLESTCAMAMTTIGTPYYFSPEICRNKPYSFKSDVWALGVVCYEMMALRVPFDAQNLPQLRERILATKPMPPPQQYSKDLVKMIAAMLAKGPERRPTVSQVLAMPFLEGQYKTFLKKNADEAAAGNSSAAANAVAPAPAPAPKAAEPTGDSGKAELDGLRNKMKKNWPAQKKEFDDAMAKLEKKKQELENKILREKKNLASSIKAEFVGEGGGGGSSDVAAPSEGGDGLSKKEQILKQKQVRQEQEDKQRKDELAKAARENADVRNQAKQRHSAELHGDPGQSVASPGAKLEPSPPVTKAADGAEASPRGAKKVHFCIEAGSPLSEEIVAQLSKDEDKALAGSIKKMEGEFADTCERQHHLQAANKEDNDMQEIAALAKTQLQAMENKEVEEYKEERGDDDGYTGNAKEPIVVGVSVGANGELLRPKTPVDASDFESNLNPAVVNSAMAADRNLAAKGLPRQQQSSAAANQPRSNVGKVLPPM
jgi:serine/threonine protein kinase